MLPKPLAISIVCAITVVWLANFAAQFIVPGYQVDGWVHTIFLTVVGGALGLSRKQNKGGGPDDPPDPPAVPAGPDDAPPPPPPDPRPSGAHRVRLFFPRSVTT